MASTITAGTTSGTALNFAGDTSGVLSVQGVTIGGTGGLGTGNSSIMKNRIINGAMVIDQRNVGASFTPTNGSYGVDRWKFALSQTSKITAQQTSTAPIGFTNSFAITSSSAYSIAAGDLFLVSQAIEGFNTADLNWGSANAKTVTLSFWVRSSLTGTFGGAIRNSDSSRCYPFSYTISAANTYEQKTITIAGDTTGTWLTTNGAGMTVSFSLGVGSTFSGTAGAWSGTTYYSSTGATSVVGTNGATFYITGVQLEVGSSATGFEYRQYQQELALCQRYYTTGENYNISTLSNGSNIGNSVQFKTTMRTAPTVVQTNTQAVNFSTTTGQTNITANSYTSFRLATATGPGQYTETYTASAEL